VHRRGNLIERNEFNEDRFGGFEFSSQFPACVLQLLHVMLPASSASRFVVKIATF
jgi:hypothetical protein